MSPFDMHLRTYIMDWFFPTSGSAGGSTFAPNLLQICYKSVGSLWFSLHFWLWVLALLKNHSPSPTIALFLWFFSSLPHWLRYGIQTCFCNCPSGNKLHSWTELWHVFMHTLEGLAPTPLEGSPCSFQDTNGFWLFFVVVVVAYSFDVSSKKLCQD